VTLPFRRRHNDAEATHDRARALSSRRLLEPLDADDAAWLNRHLDACTECRRDDQAYAADHDLLRSLRDVTIEPPRDLWARTSAALDQAAGKRPQPARSGPGRAAWPGFPVRAAAGVFALLVVIGAALLPGALPGRPGGSPVAVVVPSIEPGPTAINVDTAAIPAARVGQDGKLDLFFTDVHKVCPRSSPECVPPPSQGVGTSVDLLGARDSTVTMSPHNDQLVFESESRTAGEGKIYIVPVGAASQPSQAPSTPSASPAGASTPPSEPPVSGEPTPGATPFGQVEIASGVTLVGEVAYSADGQWLAFSAAPKDGSTGPDLYLYAAGSPAAVAVTSDHQTYFSAWLGNRVLASHIVTAAQPGASGNPEEPNGPGASGNGNNGNGNGSNGNGDGSNGNGNGNNGNGKGNGQGQALVGHPSSFLLDPATSTRTELVQPDVWLPVVDTNARLVAYWSGTLRSTDGVAWQLDEGRLVLDAWNAGTPASPDASPSAEPTTAGASASPAPEVGPAGHATQLVTSHVEDFRTRFDPDGIRLAVWVSERAGETDGRLHLVVIDPATATVAPTSPLQGEPALRRFSIDANRLAWVSPSGQDGHESTLKVLGWSGDSFGQIQTEPAQNLLILR
jgi:hypothetical protein